ncbi:SMP-30/gluconolactonase/LRE family protein [Pseudocolwellia agarivorans]|uniref:SMP-30/gluconolactonase/LRE family protein n=1 Tax=Pseudocolwellia agarivorans TaxID=1911682 RepID=UPI000986C8B0|nr:SMP-30/gluconolactonase/LRE family protein [Pseudocolwellia agarivorans]
MFSLIKNIPSKCGLGEGCVWSADDNAFYWIDITKPNLYKYSVETDTVEKFETPNNPANVFLTQQPNVLLVTLFDGLYLFNLEQQTWELWRDIEPDKTLRLNDGTVDCNGNLLIGSITMTPDENGQDVPVDFDGRLFSVKESESTIEGDSIGVFNLATFSPDNKIFYYADSMKGEIYACDFDTEKSTVGKPKLLNKLDEKYGGPDGGACDSEGYIWNARWDGKGVVRISPQGELVDFFEVPTTRVTSLCFGGKDLKTLLVTTAELDMEHEAHSGNTFLFQVDVAGLAPFKTKLV